MSSIFIIKGTMPFSKCRLSYILELTFVPLTPVTPQVSTKFSSLCLGMEPFTDDSR